MKFFCLVLAHICVIVKYARFVFDWNYVLYLKSCKSLNIITCKLCTGYKTIMGLENFWHFFFLKIYH